MLNPYNTRWVEFKRSHGLIGYIYHSMWDHAIRRWAAVGENDHLNGGIGGTQTKWTFGGCSFSTIANIIAAEVINLTHGIFLIGQEVYRFLSVTEGQYKLQKAQPRRTPLRIHMVTERLLLALFLPSPTEAFLANRFDKTNTPDDAEPDVTTCESNKDNYS